jgi:hypothetical protein
VLLPWAELQGLYGVALAAPLLDAFRNSPETLTSVDAGALEVIVLALAIVCGPPLLVLVVELLAARVHPRAQLVVHLAAIAVCGGALALRIGREFTGGHRRLLVAGLVGAALVAFVVARFSVARSWVRVLAVASVAFLVMFLVSPPVRAVAFGGEPVEVADVRAGRPAPVVLLVVDELPLVSLLGEDDAVDRELFPNFSRLSADATWYRNSTTVASNTPEAVPAILTGRRPTHLLSPLVHAAHPENLFTLLGGTYALNVHETVSELCPPELCEVQQEPSARAVRSLLGEAVRLGGQLLEPRRPRRDAQLPILTPTEQVRAFERFARSLGPAGEEQPSLSFLHVVLPHAPWTFLPDGRRHNAPSLLPGVFHEEWIDGHAGAVGNQLHILQAQFVDRLLGRLLDRLARLGTYDESLVVVTADHGIAFTAGDIPRSIADNPVETVWTPLFIKAPGQTSGRLVEDPVRSIDVVPTIADILDVDIPWAVEGRSLLRGGDHHDEEVEVFGTGDLLGETQVLDGARGYQVALRRPPLHATTGDPDLRPFRIGRYGDLVGQRSPERPDTADGVVGRFFDPGAWTNVDLDHGVVPAYVDGQVESEGPVTVAVAVNGTIGGWSPTYLDGRTDDDGDEGRETRSFWMVVPPQLFEEGHNDVALLVVDGQGNETRLRAPRRAE